MPIISRFFGIIVTMNYREHGPPHFHAWYSGHEITVAINDGAVAGEMPKRAFGLIMEWLELHRAELGENWKRAEARLPLTTDRAAGIAMNYTVIDARYVKDYTIWLRFADGTEGDVDLTDELWGPVFEPLKDPELFRQFEVAEYGTLAWPNGADLAPEFLYSRARVAARA